MEGAFGLSRKSKIAIVEKVTITQEYIARNISREKAARQAEVDHNVITEWARIYRREEALGLEPQEQNRAYSPELGSTLSAKNTQFAQKHNFSWRFQLR